MKKIMIIIPVLVLIASMCYAETFRVPFRCYESQLIREFKKVGINLDKDDPNSDGYIENLGSSYKIHTYRRTNKKSPFITIPLKVGNLNGN